MIVGFSAKSVGVCGLLLLAAAAAVVVSSVNEWARKGLFGESRTGPEDGGDSTCEGGVVGRVTVRRREGGGDTGALGAAPDLNSVETGGVEGEVEVGRGLVGLSVCFGVTVGLGPPQKVASSSSSWRVLPLRRRRFLFLSGTTASWSSTTTSGRRSTASVSVSVSLPLSLSLSLWDALECFRLWWVRGGVGNDAVEADLFSGRR